jgi:hypothetical protein
VGEILAGLTPLDSYAEATGSVSKAANVMKAMSGPSQDSIKSYLTSLSGRELSAGAVITGPKTSLELLAVLRDRMETISGESLISNQEKSSRELTWRVALGYSAKDFATKITADKEKQELTFKGSVGKTKLDILYSKSDIKAEWSRWIENTTNVEISQEVLKNKTGNMKLGLRYTGYNNTVSIQDATNKSAKDLVGPTVHIILTPKESLSMYANLGGLIEGGKFSGMSMSTGITGKKMRADLSVDSLKGYEKTSFTVGYKF